MNEIAVALGPDRRLIGVVTPPAAADRRLGIVLLNAGVVHRIGPHRNSVKLARHLAALGYTALRFDISGVGDSRMPRHAAPMPEQALADVKAALDHLQSEHGVPACGLYGICAGARLAYRAAMADERVAGIFMIDGYAYSTWKSAWVRQFDRLRGLTPQRVSAAVARRLARLRRSPKPDDGTAGDATALAQPTALSGRPTRERFAADVQALVDRGVQVEALYTGSAYSAYCYAGQWRDAFARERFIDRVVCHHAPDIDHLITPLAAQRRVLDIAAAWMERTLAAPCATSAFSRHAPQRAAPSPGAAS